MNDSPNNSKQTEVAIRPPQIFRSLVGGFHAVASNAGLLLVPLALDLLLWFGPHLRVKRLFEPALLEMMTLLRRYNPPSATPQGMDINTLQKAGQEFLERYNLFGSLSTFPLGVPSQMASMMPVETPAGSPQFMEIGSGWTFLFGWLGLTLLGFILASLYFAVIARACTRFLAAANPEGMADCEPNAPARLLGRNGNSLPRFGLGTLAWETLQMIALVLLLFIVVMIIMVPVLMVATLLAQLSLFVAWFLLMMVGFAVIWFLVPLVFSPHGIFMCGQSLLNAMLNSTRVVRYSLPGTGLFLTALILINQMLGSLWISAPETSWMALVGLFGHAFVSTALLAATFVYYRSGLTYVQNLRGLARKSV